MTTPRPEMEGGVGFWLTALVLWSIRQLSIQFAWFGSFSARFAVIFAIGASFRAAPAAFGASMLMRQVDRAQAGANTSESILTLANVNTNLFGKLAVRAVDGKPYAQPLIVTGVNVPGAGVHNLLIVATEHDSVFAFDADDTSPGASPLWQASFINATAGVTPVDPSDVSTTVINPEIGITGTPVVDADTGTIYVVAKTRETGPTGVTFANRLHALDVSTGLERTGSPVLLTATLNGTGAGSDPKGRILFNQRLQMNRPGLVLVKNQAHPNGMVYVAMGSHFDVGAYHGWVFGVDAASMSIVQSFNTSPNGRAGGIWMSGAAPSVDNDGNIYIVTANGNFDAATSSFGDSILKLDTSGPNLSVADYFTPYDQYLMDIYDKDLGACGLLLLPDSVGSALHPHLAVGSGKTGTIYLIDRDNMGHFNPLDDSQIVQTLPIVLGNVYGAMWASPTFFDGWVYFGATGDRIKAYSVKNGLLSPTPVSMSRLYYGYPGPTPFISANGTNNAILWTIEHPTTPTDPTVLHAYSAKDLSIELYNSSQMGQKDKPGPFITYNPPVVANGKVYVAVSNAIVLYGLFTKAATPAFVPPAGTYVDSVTVSLVGAPAGAEVHYTTNGTAPTATSPLYTGAVTFTNSATIRAKAFVPGMFDSDIATARFAIAGAGPGHGSGLLGSYWSNQVAGMAGQPVLSRVDASIVFSDWSGTGPSPVVGSNNYTVRWMGTVQPQFNETFTFYVAADGGVRLSVDGQALVDSWHDQPLADHSGAILLKAGQRYSIQLDYFHTSGNAAISLDWSSASVPREHVPTRQIYPPNVPPVISLDHPVSGTVASGPASISLIASALDTDGSVTGVTFFEGNQLLASLTNPPYAVTLTGVGAGTHKYYAIATDDLGAAGSTDVATVTVVPGSGVPFGLDSRPPVTAYLNFPGDVTSGLPLLISQTGAFADLPNLTPTTGILPYSINVPFWSDGALKQRWMALPNDGGVLTPDRQIGFSPDGDWKFPAGTVFIKHFDILTNENDPQSLRRLETRFIVNLTNGLVYGSTYKWRPDHLDADLVTSGLTEDIPILTSSGVRTQKWYYPGPSDCLICHNTAASGVLGPSKTRQLNGNFTYPSSQITDNQVRTWNHLGLFYPAIDEADISGFDHLSPIGDVAASIERQARSFLDVNCSYCHRPDAVPGRFDARITTPLSLANIINGTSGGGSSGLPPVTPGDPLNSGIYQRVNTVNPLVKMPPIARNEIATAAAGALAAWINSMVNFTPVLPSIGAQILSEWDTLRVTNTATELSMNSHLTYMLVNAPTGAAIDSNGIISWTPGQIQSPGTYTITTIATASDTMDALNPVLKATNSFAVSVKEVNVAPVLPAIGNRTGSQWQVIKVTNTATEPNIHASVGYALLNPPAGATIDGSGIISWVTSQSQTPGIFVIRTVATSTDPLDAANPVLKSTNQFSVVLNETHWAPWWSSSPADRTVNELTPMIVTNTATQTLVHAKVAYILVNPPVGASIDANGIISWTPGQTQSPGTNRFITVVTSTDSYDSVNPVLKITNSFLAVVKEVNVAPLLPTIGTQTVNELSTLTVTNTAGESNIHAVVTYQLLNPPAGAAIDSSGIISWIPSQAQSPGTNTITTVAVATDVFDTVNPVMKATNSFTVVVKEVNVAPVLPVIGNRTGSQWQVIKVTNTATEPNIRASVGYALLNPPAGAAIDGSGIISWITSQSQTPGTFVIRTVATATDLLDVANPVLKSTNQFSVVLNETHWAPWWSASPADRTVNELTPMIVTNTATQTLVHAKVAYVLVNPPVGATIDVNGIISWTPGQTQSPSTNRFITVVTSTDSYDSVNPILKATNSFLAVVKEVNVAPLLPTIGTQTVNELATLTVTNTASEPNIHAVVTYQLPNAPAGVAIDPNGIISWTPGQTQNPSTNSITTIAVATDVLDFLNPVLKATNRFSVVVNRLTLGAKERGDVGAIRILPMVLTSNSFQLRVEGAAGITYVLQASETLEPGDWKDIQVLTTEATPFSMRDTNISSFPERFYRVRLASPEDAQK